MAPVEKVRVLGADPPSERRSARTSPPRWGLIATVILMSLLFGYLAGTERTSAPTPTAVVAPLLLIVEHNPDPAVIGPASPGSLQSSAGH
ncbi:MAG: hypothetical protein KJO18_00735 [Acidimicrobiia bacterium]|nr:hypothetical protein [Acidimicrobiia bacterium]